MYLKSITLKGFKSFVDRTRLEFGPGVSVIVGPNGSGKSNVTDAVLWALGEQSPVAVRGQSMQDVIFAGAPGRQAARTAEVELVLDDSEGTLGLGPEISIVRKLDRCGEGEYRLAGARCRLIDVIEVLSDTGLGKEMHSVISQGRVEAIVTSKPRERRLLIEEAAGLGKHRKRRRRAQLKLARTQDNLDRALDVEREARSQLRPLKRQAEAAELHARLERQSLEARWELTRDDLRIELHALDRAQHEAAQAHERRERLETELRAVSRRRDEAEQALAARSAQREELSRRCFAARAALERMNDRAASVEGAAAAVEHRVARGRRLLAGLEEESTSQPTADAGRGQRLADLRQELAALERDREAELARQLEELEQQRGAASTALQRREAELEASGDEREQRESELALARAKLREAEREVEATRREAARVGAELAAANQFLRSHQAVSGASAPLSEALEVESGYELALAAALDGRLRAALVPDRDAAASLLDQAGADGGRTLVLRAPTRRAGGDESPPPEPGALRLADRLRGDGAASALARALLRDVWIVEDIASLPAQFGGTAVTRAGRVWSAATGELRQAAAVGDERVLAERNRRERLIGESARAVQAEQAARRSSEAASELMAAKEAERERAVEQRRAAANRRDEAAEVQRRLAAVIERRRRAPDEGEGAGRRAQLRAEITAEQALIEREQRERAERQARLESLRAQLVRDEQLVPAISRLLEAISAAAAAGSAQRAAFERALETDREAGEHVAAQLRACAQEEASLHARLHTENESLTALEVAAQRARDQVQEQQQALHELAQRLELEAEPAIEALAQEQRDALSARVERLARRREQLGPVNPLAQEQYAEAVEHVEELERQREDLETALRELEKLIADTDRQIRETFEGTFAAAARNFEELAGQLFPGGRGQLRLVREREGAPRVLGGEPAPDAEEPAEAEAATSGADEEDLLGVEIEITPAGKEMKRLSLLSGGEKSMTALAFLFAVFLARPCPFYILDEVEAALDDLNIDRFLALLRQYCTRAQFIVVTHQKRTMEAADSLYGVSMGGDGISKVISRRLPPQTLAA